LDSQNYAKTTQKTILGNFIDLSDKTISWGGVIALNSNEQIEKVKEGLIAWIDILNFRNQSVDSQLKAIKSAVDAKQISQINLAVVGDAICFATSEESTYDAFFLILFGLSAGLYSAGFSNRGYVVKGDFVATKINNEFPVIVGKGVIEAYQLENSLKISAIGISDDALVEFQNRKTVADRRFTRRKICNHRLISGGVHFREWQNFCSSDGHRYQRRAKRILNCSSLWENLLST